MNKPSFLSSFKNKGIFFSFFILLGKGERIFLLSLLCWTMASPKIIFSYHIISPVLQQMCPDEYTSFIMALFEPDYNTIRQLKNHEINKKIVQLLNCDDDFQEIFFSLC